MTKVIMPPLNKWSDEVKMSMALEMTEGRVKAHLRHWITDRRESQVEITWETMQTFLQEREKNEPLLLQKRLKLMTLKQNNRPLHDFILEL